MKFLNYILFLILISVLYKDASSQWQEPTTGRIVLREILALYKGSENRSEENNEIYLYAQLPLNYLGFKVHYLNAEGQLPDDTEMQKYRGIITWFQSPEMIGAAKYRRWLLHQLRDGKRVIIFENLGAFREKSRPQGQRDRQEVAEVFRHLGLQFLYNYTNDTSKIRVAYVDRGMMAFEREPVSFPIYERIVSIDRRNRVYLSLLRTDLVNSKSDVVVITPNGGFAFTGCFLWEYENEDVYYTQWYLNPFRFFSEALDVAEEPKPDIATLNGRRIFFSHIDGDGMSSVSHIDNHYLCGEIIRDHVLKAYPLPFTVSVITSMIDPLVLGNLQRMQVARSLFSLPNVEAASHGFAHPFDWRRGILQIKDIPGYSMNIEREIKGSIDFINDRLLPSGKRVQLFLWTGECNPDEATLAYVRRLGIRAMNGGEGMVDAKMPTISVITPATVQTGNQIRVNARASNDYEFTKRWSGPYDGYRNVIATFKAGDRIYRTTPIDVYFHFYSGEREQSLNALKNVFTWALQQEITPIYASQYYDIVMDFLDTKIWKEGENRWLLHNKGPLRTVRFDMREKFPDLTQSRNVIGYKQNGDYLYIHLNESRTHYIVLTASPPEEIYLMEANAYIDGWKADSSSVAFQARGYGQLYMKIANMQKNCLYQIENLGDGTITYCKSDADGNLTFKGSIRGRAYPAREKFRVRKSNRRSYYVHQGKLALLLIILCSFVIWYLYRTREKK